MGFLTRRRIEYGWMFLHGMQRKMRRASRSRRGDATSIIDSEQDPLLSQKGQVRFVLEVAFNYSSTGLKREGFFVDLAAGHPILNSNTYFLEKQLGWRGLLVEPNPNFAAEIRRLRVSPCLEAVVSDREELVDFRFDNGELGGIVGDEFDNSWSQRGQELRQADIKTVKTIRLDSILANNECPSVMDYLSLDVEGAEMRVLTDFDFGRWRWRCMTIERPSLELNLILDEVGYIQVMHSQFDTFYIHKEFMASANTSILNPTFISMPRKIW